MTTPTCFKAYDSRERLGIDRDDGIADQIGRGSSRFIEHVTGI